MNTLSLQPPHALHQVLARWAEAYRAQAESPLPGAAVKDAWSDEALMEAIVKRGSQQHFRALMARYKTRVHQLCLSVLGPSQQAQAEDAAQEVFARLHQCLDLFRGDCRFSTWLHRIAINTAIDYQRQNSRFQASELDDTRLAETTHGMAVLTEY